MGKASGRGYDAATYTPDTLLEKHKPGTGTAQTLGIVVCYSSVSLAIEVLQYLCPIMGIFG